jgi:hypothetical protein
VRVLNRCGGIAALALCGMAAYAAAGGDGDYLSYRFQYFSDNSDVRVVTNTMTVSKDAGRHLGFTGTYTLDGITSASRIDVRGRGGSSGTVDAITAASRRPEQRQAGGASVIFRDDWLKRLFPRAGNENPAQLSCAGMYGSEPDYLSRTASVALRQELFAKNTAIEIAYGRNFDQFRPVSRYRPGADNQGWNYIGNGRRYTDRISAGVSQALNRETLVSAAGEYGYDRGYLARPYYVYEIETALPAGGTIRAFYHENAPVIRESAAFSGQVNRYLPLLQGASVNADYRYYRDSWEVRSHTLTLTSNIRVMDNIIVCPLYRYYSQTAAFYYRDAYASVPAYLTTDLRLGPYSTTTAGIKLVFALRDFVKPVDNAFFALFPVSLDIAANYMVRSGTADIAVRDSHYGYWPIGEGYRNFWIQSGTKFAF